jgi:hypothetical protein
VSTVGTSAALGSLVDLDVLDDKVAGVETLGVGVGLSVLEEIDEELGGLDGPAGTGDTPLLSWRKSASLFNPLCIPKFRPNPHQFHLFIKNFSTQNSSNPSLKQRIGIVCTHPGRCGQCC